MTEDTSEDNNPITDWEDFLYINAIYHRFRHTEQKTIRKLFVHLNPLTPKEGDLRLARCLEYLADFCTILDLE